MLGPGARQQVPSPRGRKQCKHILRWEKNNWPTGSGLVAHSDMWKQLLSHMGRHHTTARFSGCTHTWEQQVTRELMGSRRIGRQATDLPFDCSWVASEATYKCVPNQEPPPPPPPPTHLLLCIFRRQKSARVHKREETRR